jgi:hypothetical protein
MNNFNITLIDNFEFSDFINIMEKTVSDLKPIDFVYEYCIDTIKGSYREKKFKAFNDFMLFYNENDYRFDSLKMNFLDETYVDFGKSRESCGVHGIINSIRNFDKIIRLTNKNVLYAFLHNDLDILLSRTNKYRSWERKLGTVPTYIKFYENPRFAGGERDKYLIDLESVPTHHHFIKTGDKLWFGACAIMYFSELYYKYIPKEIWEEFTDCEENVNLENGLRKIVLYNDLTDFENPDNRKKQWAFRNQLGVDEVAHKLIQDGSTPTVV